MINSVDNVKHKAVLMLVYSAGLRVGEVVRLKPENIDRCGTDLRYIQELLGHAHSKATEIYTHVSTKNLGKIRSPLDSISTLKGGGK